MYTIDNLERDIETREKKLAEIRKDRGLRYGGKNDTLENVATFGWRGAVINAYECAQRLKNLFGQKDPDIEDIRNAADDLTNYSHYIEILINREFPIQENKPKWESKVIEWTNPNQKV